MVLHQLARQRCTCTKAPKGFWIPASGPEELSQRLLAEREALQKLSALSLRERVPPSEQSLLLQDFQVLYLLLLTLLLSLFEKLSHKLLYTHLGVSWQIR